MRQLQPQSGSRVSTKKSLGLWIRAAGIIAIALTVSSVQARDLVSFEVEQAGLYKVTYAQLKAKGLDLSGVAVGRLGIEQANKTWPLQVYPKNTTTFGTGSSIVFPANGLTTLYTGKNKYTLVLNDVLGAGHITEDSSALPDDTAPAPSYLAEKTYAPQNHYSLKSPSDDDDWFADKIYALTGPASKEVTLSITDYAPALNSGFNRGNIKRMPTPRPRLEVNLWGSSGLPGNGLEKPDHHVLIDLNGERVADERFDDLRVYPVEKVLSQLKHGVNKVKVSVPGDHGYQFDLIDLDRITIRYPRMFKAQNSGKSLVFESPWNFFKVNELSSSNVTVIRVDPVGGDYEGHEMMARNTNPNCANGTSCAYFRGSDTTQTSTYYVATQNGFKTPTISLLAANDDINSGEANYLIIAHPDFNGSALQGYAAELANLYGGADIVNVESIYAQYSGHVVDATAIQNYIKHAYAERNTRHVMLVGGDMYDYHGNLGNNAKSFIPSLYVKVASNVNAVASDAKYADVDDDFIPDMTITRLPVRTTAELNRLLSKRQSYLARDYEDVAVFAADKKDGSGYSFKGDALQSISSHFSSWNVSQVYVDDVSIDAGTQALSSALNSGSSITSYFGHSNTDRWAIRGLLTSSDVASLNNANRPTVVAQWGCWNTFHVSPEQDSLAHRFLVDGDYGAVTVMGASSVTKATAEKRMADLLYARLNQGMRIGDAVLSAKRALAEETPYQLDVLLGWAVLGPDDMPVLND